MYCRQVLPSLAINCSSKLKIQFLSCSNVEKKTFLNMDHFSLGTNTDEIMLLIYAGHRVATGYIPWSFLKEEPPSFLLFR